MNKLPDGWEHSGIAVYLRRDGARVYDYDDDRWVAVNPDGIPHMFDYSTAHAAMLALNEKYPMEVKDGKG